MPDIAEPSSATARGRRGSLALGAADDDARSRAAAAAPRPRAGGRARRPRRANCRSSRSTRLLSDFADRAIDERSPPRSRERVPDARAAGLRRHRHGQARQPRAQLFVRRRPAAAVRSGDACRGASATMPGEAAVRIGRRHDRNPPEADRRRLCRAGRPAASAVARSDADRAAGECRDLALRIERPAVGTRGVHPRPRRGRRPRAWAAVPRRDPAVRLAALARFRSDRGSAADLGADPRPFRARRASSGPATTSSAGAAESAKSSSSSRSSR